jgi:hypothetical protein
MHDDTSRAFLAALGIPTREQMLAAFQAIDLGEGWTWKEPGYWGFTFGENDRYELAVEPGVFLGVDIAIYDKGILVTKEKIALRLGRIQ